MLTKVLSVVALHQLIGTRWRRDAAIRKDVGLHTLQFKALEMIVSRNGFDCAKLTLLAAGPDWPIGVFTGMLNIPLLRVLVYQTIPSFFFVVAPSTIAGAAQLRIRESELWHTLSITLLCACAAFQGIGLLAFNFWLSHIAEENEEYLMDKPNDREVEELNEIFEATVAPLERDLDKATHWHDGTLPLAVRVAIIVGMISLTLSCTFTRFASRLCFADLQINDSLRCPSASDASNPRRLQLRSCYHSSVQYLIFRLGWAVLALGALGFVCMKCFDFWKNKVYAKIKADSAVLAAPAEFVKIPSFSRKRLSGVVHIPDEIALM